MSELNYGPLSEITISGMPYLEKCGFKFVIIVEMSVFRSSSISMKLD